MIPRLLSNTLRTHLRAFPAVALVGPRQVGKTTLAKTLSSLYFDFEQEEDRLQFDVAWNQLQTSKRLIVLDEVQAWPEVFPRLRGAIDQDRKRRGRFLLLGSVSPALMKNVSESLAGRLAICELTPFLLPEWSGRHPEEALWPMGGFPDGSPLAPKAFPHWQRNYLNLLAMRDLPQWGLPAKPQTTLRLFQMLAHCHGQIWNASQIGRSLGLNYQTIDSYMEYLQEAFLIRFLLPYHANLRKRLTKSPKFYWRDSGLLHSLLGVQDRKELLSKPWVGASWEGWVIQQLLDYLHTKGETFEASYLRTNDGHELDLLLSYKGQLWAFEIKLTSVPSQEDFAHLNKTADLVKAHQRVLISRTTKSIHAANRISSHLEGVLNLL